MSARLVRVGPIFSATGINAAATATSAAIDLRYMTPKYLYLDASSATGTATLKVEVVVSHDGSAFGGYADYDDIIADTSDVAEFPTVDALRAVPLPNILHNTVVKFRVTGLGGNPADTIINSMYLVGEEY
jgi:hypothetical protein